MGRGYSFVLAVIIFIFFHKCLKMYVNDIKSDFFDFLTGKHFVIIAHHDLDAICTCRILQSLLKYDSIQYSLIPVQGLQDLKSAYEECCVEVKIFILINCGATFDLIDVLDPAEDIIFFVLDSHRPTDLCNIYNSGQIRLLWTQSDDQMVPDFDDIFREEEVENTEENIDSDSETEEESRIAKRLRMGEEEVLKLREKRLWEEHKNKLLFEYGQYSYYTKASAMTVFNLAHTLAKDTKELLWLTILALTSQYMLAQIESSQYTVFAGNLQLDVERLNRRTNTAENLSNSLKISIEKELKIALFRHWSVEKSLNCSLYTACKLKLWSKKGERRLQELLADMGLPLAQSKQRFSAMELTYRTEFANKLEKCGEKFGLDDLNYPSFMAQFGFRLKYGATDMVYIVLAILEQTSQNKHPDASFGEALDCLNRAPPQELLTMGLERAKIILESCQKIMKTALDQRRVYSAGPFLYYILHESCPDSHLFYKPHALLLLARYIQQGYCDRYGSKTSANAMPLLISVPKRSAVYQQNGIINTEEITYSQGSRASQILRPRNITQSSINEMEDEEEFCMLLGLPPLCENSPKNFFGKAFEQAAEKSNSTTTIEHFDSSYIQLRIADRTRFLDSLTALLS